MTTVEIDSGICGFRTTVTVSKAEGRNVAIAIESPCERIRALSNEVREIGMMELLGAPIHQIPVYVKAGECKLHAGCPVPCGIVKAAEADLGLALKKDVRITFGVEVSR